MLHFLERHQIAFARRHFHAVAVDGFGVRRPVQRLQSLAPRQIDRRILGSRVFGKPEEMRKLTTAIGDIAEAVREVIVDWRKTLGQGDVALMEAVNLIEAGYGQWCDQVWLFASDDDTVRKRLEARNRYTPEEIDQRIASQRSWEDRALASDLVIFNQDSYAELESQVRTELGRTRELWNNGELPASKYHAWWEENGRSEG